MKWSSSYFKRFRRLAALASSARNSGAEYQTRGQPLYRLSMISDDFFVSECGGGEVEGLLSQKHFSSAVGYATPVEISVPDRHHYSEDACLPIN